MQSICTYNILCIVVFIIECIDLCVIHSCAYRNMINARKFFFFTCSKFHFHIAAPERKQRVSFGWWAHFQEKHVYICWFTWRQAAESTMWNYEYSFVWTMGANSSRPNFGSWMEAFVAGVCSQMSHFSWNWRPNLSFSINALISVSETDFSF